MSKQEIDKEWPEEMIRRLRQRSRPGNKAKLRQIDLSKRIGVETRTVQQWEIGERLPSAHNLQKLIQVFTEEGIFLPGSVQEEAQSLWETVSHFHNLKSGNYRMYPKFDDQWFDTIQFAPKPNSSQDGVSAGEPVVQATQERIPTNLPSRMSGFIGRQQQITDITQLLASAPLVTLTGPGGCGKTRLAYQVASEAMPRYRDGVWIIELAAAADSVMAIRMLASVLGVKEQRGHTLLESLLELLRDKRMLLVLDNCEHLIDSCAALVESMLAVSSYLTVLATGREPFHTAVETVWQVPPLSCPRLEGDSEPMTYEALMQFEAVQLFVERAKAIATTFDNSQEEGNLIASICVRLEGIPLSLELAAARSNVLSLQQIDRRLSDMLGLLSSGQRTANSRHQTLRATMEWSYSLLTQNERLMLNRLSVFTGGFDLEAVEAIGTAQGMAAPPELFAGIRFQREEALDLVSNLVSKSMVSTEILRAGNNRRFFLLEAIKQFARETWLSSETDEERDHIRHLHAEYYCSLVERMGRDFRSRSRDTALLAIRQDYANICSVLEWASTRAQEADTALRMAAYLYFFWLHEGALDEGITRLQQALLVSGEQSSNPNFVKVRHGVGILLWVKGETEEAFRYAQQSVKDARKLGSPGLLSSNLRLLTQITLHQGLTDEAAKLAGESVHCVEQDGDDWNLASSLNTLGQVLLMQGDHEQAQRQLTRSSELFERVRDYWEMSGPLRILGYLSIQKHNYDQAVTQFKRSIAICQSYHGSWFLARGLDGLANIPKQRFY
ncbi:tetratricopeptide repeat protein [Paenibacillus sp. SI8]|uniref:tetratricopeptide repeat protein n=1 Tax=unclassified Paenibacillus TaxID=185978 RepID=UPI003465B268